MRHWILALLLCGCTSMNPAREFASDGGAGAGGGSGGGAGGAGGAGGGSGGDAGGVGGASGLPCDVEQLLAARCTSCHGTRLAGGAPMPLTSYAELTAPSTANAQKRVADDCLARMKDAAAPMPPAGLLGAAELAVFAKWVAAGTPTGSCGGGGGGSDGGAGSNDPLGAAPTCTSGKHWTNGNEGSANMNPGLACISCHTRSGEGPRFSIAGTVYPTGHEPDLCNGTSQAQIIITDSAGKKLTLTPNGAGNFSSRASLTLPYRAEVVAGGRTRAMATPQMVGDCNTCHSQDGISGAPGRITVPE